MRTALACWRASGEASAAGASGAKMGRALEGEARPWQAQVRGLQGMRWVGVLYEDPVGCAGKGLDNQGDRPGAR